ncbi:transcription termination/antitermination NusG family protein [Enterobacter ludwigii]|uniref:transcription termination/antitermination NusG family protein n=1 Tax=Enterobacter TaxID=547 RepID=UPI003BEEB50E
MEQWYLACYKPGKDNIYKAQLALSRISTTDFFCPQLRTKRPRTDRPGQFRQVIEPLFPGYLFVAFDPEVIHTSRIEACPGVNYLVRSAGQITPIRPLIIDQLMCLPLCRDAASRKPLPHVRRRQQRIARQLDDFIRDTVPEERGALCLALLQSLEAECDQ